MWVLVVEISSVQHALEFLVLHSFNFIIISRTLGNLPNTKLLHMKAVNRSTYGKLPPLTVDFWPLEFQKVVLRQKWKFFFSNKMVPFTSKVEVESKVWTDLKTITCSWTNYVAHVNDKFWEFRLVLPLAQLLYLQQSRLSDCNTIDCQLVDWVLGILNPLYESRIWS